MRYLSALLGIALCPLAVHAQGGVEDVMVETYAVTPAATVGGAPLVTYRIYVDLAPGYELQMVYGDAHHQLKINTSTDFFNDTIHGAKFADMIDGDRLNTYPTALDTWLTIGAASDHHQGVPKQLDVDGSQLECPPYEDVRTGVPGASGRRTEPLCVVDGLHADTAVKQIVDFQFASGYLDKVRGGSLETTDGAWGALGHVKGATPENMVLIAQLSTTGEISFKLNLQVGTPDHRVEKYVSSDPAEGEFLFSGLLYGALAPH